ncbi:MAG TPA: methionine gamma-lyase family protein [Bacillota bacterium]|nr:methionine gamma-lyase family protein [Bacillota bacterium]
MQIDLLVERADRELRQQFYELEKRTANHQERVLDAFAAERVADFHLHGSTGYGYGDSGREVIEHIYAALFGGEAALVRGHFASGTHAISSALFAVARPGDEILVGTGQPYDTLHGVLGLSGQGASSLRAWGISTTVIPQLPEGGIDLATALKHITPRSKVLYLQRSRGYSWRRAITVLEIGNAIRAVRQVKPDIIVLVDNCYGEFVEELEPGHVGADLTAGSLIKNPGGGLALSGGYVVGKRDLINLVSESLYAPGLGGKVGATTVFNRSILQGLFMAPTVVEASLKGAMLLARCGELLNLAVSPGAIDFRSDIIQALGLGSREAVVEFCRGIQRASPIDSHVSPEAGSLPGYDCEVIMAAGTFVQGASSELSADAPLREPYAVYVQGGLSYAHVRVAIARALSRITRHLSIPG